jgi:ATP-binding cassette, subfamily B, bacterial
MKYFRRILPYLRPYWKLVTLSIALTVLISVASLLAPWPLKIIIDNVLGEHPVHPALAHVGWGDDRKFALLVVAVVGGLLIAFLHHALTVLHSYVNTGFEQRMILDFRSDMFQHAQRLSLAFHDQRRSGGLIYAINYQADSAVSLIGASAGAERDHARRNVLGNVENQ